MTTEPKGPYPNVLYEQDYTIMQADYDRGFKAGRASRDGLREALGVLGQNLGSEVLKFGRICTSQQRVIDFITEALAEDETTRDTA